MNFHTTWWSAPVLFLMRKNVLIIHYSTKSWCYSSDAGLLAFCFISTQTAGEWTIYPWIHSNCNSLSDNDQLRPVSIPDIHPARFLSFLWHISYSSFSWYILSMNHLVSIKPKSNFWYISLFILWIFGFILTWEKWKGKRRDKCSSGVFTWCSLARCYIWLFLFENIY